MSVLHHDRGFKQFWLLKIFFIFRLMLLKSSKFRAPIASGIIVLAIALCIPTSKAFASWSWSFNDEVINLAVQQRAYISFTNDQSSNQNLWVTGIDGLSFGNFGLLYEPGFVGIITPTIQTINQVLSPGETNQVLAIVFNLTSGNLPTPGVSYEINPKLQALVGMNCGSGQSNDCSFESQNPTRLLTLTYSPVSEPPIVILFFTGMILLGFQVALAKVRKNDWLLNKNNATS